mmetsp:Transcript_45427/g.83082  ORF Transcript_45427/g.83082 Transcript_45427/m.83082 type:complete len:491 (+) Transcript_45427:97-1569(+)
MGSILEGLDETVEQLAANLHGSSDTKLDLSELANLLRRTPAFRKLSNRQVRVLFNAVDTSESGSIEFQDLVQFLCNGGATFGTFSAKAVLASDPLEWKKTDPVERVRARSASTSSGSRSFPHRNSLPLLSTGNAALRVGSAPGRQPTPPQSVRQRHVGRAKPKGGEQGPLDKALSLLFDALDTDGHAALSFEQICEARRLLAPLVVGGIGHSRNVRQAPRSRALLGSFKNWAKEYLGVFDCPSDAPLARDVMNLILKIKPPHMPLQKCPADGSDEITDVLCSDCPGELLLAGHHGSHVNVDALTKLGVTHLLGIGMECSRGRPFVGLKVVARHHVPVEMSAVDAPAIAAGLEDAVDFIKVALAPSDADDIAALAENTKRGSVAPQATGKKNAVLVYCKNGQSCSAAVVLAYLIACRRLTLRGAFELLIRRRPCMWPHPALMEVLIAWEALHRKGRAGTMRLQQYKLWSAYGSYDSDHAVELGLSHDDDHA